MADFLTQYVLVLVGLMAAMSWLFVARHAYTRWWETPTGRYLMKSKTALALIFTMSLLFRVLEPPREVMLGTGAVLYTWIAYTLAELLVLQSRAKRDRKERDRNPR